MDHAELAREKDDEIWRLYIEGLNYRDIKFGAKVGGRRIFKVLIAYSQGQTLVHRKGRPPRITEETKVHVRALTEQRANLSNASVARIIRETDHVPMSASSVGVIRGKFGFKWVAPLHVPATNRDQIEGRQQFACDFTGHLWDDIRDLPIVFSDESRFATAPDSRYVWRKPGVFNFSSLCQHEKFAHISIMVWGAIGKNFKSPLVIIKGTLNAEGYKMLMRVFMQVANQQYGVGKWVFIQDGAPCHKAKKAVDFLTKEIILNHFWPANSPDLNPIEKVWAMMKKWIHWDNITKEGEAIKAIAAAWKDVTMEQINELCASFPDRVDMVKAAEGKPIGPLGKRKKVPEGYFSDWPQDAGRRPWTAFSPEEDARITELARNPKAVPKQADFATHTPYELSRRTTAMGIKETWSKVPLQEKAPAPVIPKIFFDNDHKQQLFLLQRQADKPWEISALDSNLRQYPIIFPPDVNPAVRGLEEMRLPGPPTQAELEGAEFFPQLTAWLRRQPANFPPSLWSPSNAREAREKFPPP
jgi:transposase